MNDQLHKRPVLIAVLSFEMIQTHWLEHRDEILLNRISTIAELDEGE